VTLYNADRTVRFTATPFGTSYNGAVRAEVGDVTGDGIADVVAVTNGSSRITARAAVIDGATGTVVSTPALVPASYTGVLSVAVGDVDGDGIADVALVSNEAAPRARVYRGGDFAKLADFRAGPTSGFQGRTFAALGDVNGDGRADLVVTAMYSNGTRVAAFNGQTLTRGATLANAFAPFVLGGGYAKGLFLAVGDVNNDGFADLVLGQLSGTALRVYSGQDLAVNNTRKLIATFAPAGASSSGGVRVAVEDVDGDGKADILTSSGELVSAFAGSASLPPSVLPPLLFAFDPDPLVTGGVWIG